MRVSHSIKFVTPIRSDYALLKSILATFGHQPAVDWCYQSEGKAQIVIVDADKDFNAQVAHECAQAEVVIYYTNDISLAEQKPFVLKKPAHTREFLQILKSVAQHLVEQKVAHATLEHSPLAQKIQPSHQLSLAQVQLAY